MKPTCKNCPFCDVITDEEYQKNLKCMKTSKKGRTITWSMCCIGQNVYQYFADYLEKHDRPKWCPETKSEQPIQKPASPKTIDDIDFDDLDIVEPNFDSVLD